VEDCDDYVCVHQSHGAARSTGALACSLDGEVAAKASGDNL